MKLHKTMEQTINWILLMMRECITLHAHTSNTATVKQSRFKVLFIMGYVIHAGLWSSGEYWVSISL